MAMRIDWGRSLVMTAVLLVILYVLGYVIEDRGVYCATAVVLFIAFFIIGNFAFRKRSHRGGYQ